MRRVALLRGINVGGVRVPSADLRALFSELGAANVVTVLATGNVLFDGDLAAPEIEAALSARFGYPARVLVSDVGALSAIAAAYPFPEDDEHHAYVMFVDDPAALLALCAEGEPVRAGNGVVYWRVPRGDTTTAAVAKANTRYARNAFSTTRNLLTIRKLIDA